MKHKRIRECRRCINTTANPTIKINKNGLCNVCDRYLQSLDKKRLEKELIFLKSFVKNKKYDVMVGLSGGKDSTASLYTIKNYGFSPLAFTFKIGYIDKSVFSKSKNIAKKLGVDHKIIDIKKYIRNTERECFKKMADLYNEKESNNLKEKFRKLYKEGRAYYSVKCDVSFPFVRPCQICRKIVIRAYYAEAIKHNINLVIIGINEWTGLSNNSYSAIRELQPYRNKPPVYIVHLPFLLRRKVSDIKPILERINWSFPKNERFIDTGSNNCLLSRACEVKAFSMLGFHLDSTRLAREVTVGFISKKEAKTAIKKIRRSTKSVREVLEEANIL